ncbi:hypothetical protein NC661_06510 [Aquibacillus koreensis]|uniref:Phage protein n=1 Tax=Aquibacillus koreensis TaxID=279446 RepID=A0A9X3WJZ5_9BACI|nr:hypothetical protein [Aquibacillus koreensis]MCT2535697.1 hypothetical protein [Aquibacillus koreensis]MDC3420018.1 hypothetical protein [Aquibacillus koreensis]
MSEQMRKELTKWSENKHKKKNKKKRENLSKSDLIELMGTDRPIYKRGKGGALKQK